VETNYSFYHDLLTIMMNEDHIKTNFTTTFVLL